jgi:hypothetical protein
MMVANISTEPGRKQKEGGTKTLATAEKKVFSDGRDDGDIRFQVFSKLLIHLL